MPLGQQKFLSPRDRQRRNQLLIVLALLVLAAALAAGFGLGQRAVYSGMGLDPAHYAQLQKQLVQADEKIRELEGELEVALTRHTVDREALAQLRSDLAAQKEMIGNLEEGIRFYRGLMAPGDVAEGLSIRAVALVAAGEEGSRYAYRIVVQQEASRHDQLRGNLHVEIFGELLSQSVNYPLAELAEDVDTGGVPLKFRYFQSVEGEFELPEGFEPAGIRVEVKISKPRKLEAEGEYPWQLQEKFIHVGK